MRWQGPLALIFFAGFALFEPASEARPHRVRRPPSDQPASQSDLKFLAAHFRVLAPQAQIALVQAIRDFMEAWEYANSKTYSEVSPELRQRQGMTDVALRWAALFGDEAWADGDFDCLYGGWPSKQSGGKCASPARTNPMYQQLFRAARCEAGGFLCSPALFGTGLCLEAKLQVAYNPNHTLNPERTRDLIRSTYQSCKSAASRLKLEEIVKSIAGDPEAYAALEHTVEAMAMACFERGHFQFGSSMCESAKVRMAAIKKEFFKQFPDQIVAGQCYFELDQIRKCSVPPPDWAAPVELDTREWQDYKAKEGKARYWGCGYFENVLGGDFAGIMAFRDPGSDAVYIRSPGRPWFQGNEFPMTEHLLYKMSGAKLNGADKFDGARDVQQLAGVLPGEVAKLDYFDHPASFKDVYRAMLHEITLQMKERAAEYRESTKSGPNAKLKSELSDAIRGCGEIVNAEFQKARADACQALGLPVAECRPTGSKGGDDRSGKGG